VALFLHILPAIMCQKQQGQPPVDQDLQNYEPNYTFSINKLIISGISYSNRKLTNPSNYLLLKVLM
jgi:hypothetical protein